jgi:hypothetical protein
MTQYPPPPSSQFPPAYVDPNAPRGSNGPAIASLILGIIGCVPFITGLCAVLLGIVGIRKSSREPLIGGKGLAIAGLILGLLSITGWGIISGVLGTMYVQSKPATIVAQQFLQDISAGNIDAALANSSGLTADQLQTLSKQIAPFGTLNSTKLFGFNFTSRNGQSVIPISGVAYFSKGPKSCALEMIKTGGTYKVTSCQVQ